MLALSKVARTIVELYPAQIRDELEQSIPRLMLQAGTLALEVMRAEEAGIPFSQAVERIDFPFMARVHFGVADLLQSRLPPAMLGVVKQLLDRAREGGFDDARQLLFEVAARRRDPEAAIARFLLFEAVCMNLLVFTWEQPDVGALGSLDAIEPEAERVVRELLEVPDLFESDVRPLHVLVVEMLVRLNTVHERMLDSIRTELGGLTDDFEQQIEATRLVRALDARDAAVFRPGRFDDVPGSQRIADRYPHHFPSANAVEQRRSRLRRRLRKGDFQVEPSGERLVDVILDEERKERSR